MAAVDMKAGRKDLYFPPVDEVVLVEVPEMRYLAIDGEGNPNTAVAYREAVEALYAVAYGVKFARKRGGMGPDYVVMPLEGLWWLDGEPFTPGWKERLSWTMLIRLPDDMTPERVEEVRREVARKKDLPALGGLRLEGLDEGLCAQIMHLGPYADEEPTGRRLHAAIAERGYTPRGKHHEVYIGDPRRTAPEKLRTVLRQPVRKRD